jgi:hypothetical protein
MAVNARVRVVHDDDLKDDVVLVKLCKVSHDQNVIEPELVHW